MAFLLGLLALRASTALAAPPTPLQVREADALIPSPLKLTNAAKLKARDALPNADPVTDSGIAMQLDVPQLESRDPSPVMDTSASNDDLEKRRNKPGQKGKSKVANTQNDATPSGAPKLVMLTGGSRPLESNNQPHVARRQIQSPESKQTFATFVPSFGAAGIPITKQSQLVTTYSPTTICKTAQVTSLTPLASCTTSLVPQETHICATRIQQLAAPDISVTDCDQYITYSTKYGYTQSPVTKGNDDAGCQAPEVATQTTFYAALWSDVIGAKPTSGVQIAAGPAGELTTSTWSEPATVTPPPVAVEPATATTSIFITRTTTVYPPELRH